MFKDDVSILFCSYNGEAFIREQLDSIISQTHNNWKLYISDDGSTDNTLNIVREYKEKLPENKITLLKGPGKGFAANFLSLLKRTDIKSAYYAFSDQDDIWLETKLQYGIDAIRDIEVKSASQCILYGGRTTLVDEEKKPIGQSVLFKREFKLENALLQSYAGGNTMLFNYHLKKKVETLPEHLPIVSHDWFLYLICSAFAGVNIYDPVPQILYRQHAHNIVGTNLGLRSRIRRAKQLYTGQFSEWSRVNKRALDFFLPQIAEEQKYIINAFFLCLEKGFVKRMKGFYLAKVYRQSIPETVLFFMINLFKKLL